MQRKLTSLALIGMLLMVLWPVRGPTEELSELNELRLLELRVQQLRTHLHQKAQEAPAPADLPIVDTSITLLPGFASRTSASGLTDPRGLFVDPPITGFPGRIFVVEKSLNRVSVIDTGTPMPFATGLSSPLDLLPPGSNAFGNFLYVTESDANRVSRISSTGVVTPFATFTAAPKRMAFSQAFGPSAFGDFLFVTLADGRLVKVDPTGAVNPCVTGLSGPESFVFGPGGSLFKDALYVAESTANRISKITPACTTSPFATGLSSPVGLDISRGQAWGPSDTLYVVNASTRIDRVDKNGNVTPFASGFSQADTIHFDYFLPRPNRLEPHMWVSDTTAGTVTEVFALRPSISVQIVGCNPCRAGETFAVRLIVENPGPIDVPVEVKTGFRLPDSTPVNFAPLLGNNKYFTTVLPKGFRFEGLWFSFPWPAVPPGRYCYEGSLEDPEIFSYGYLMSRWNCFTALP